MTKSCISLLLITIILLQYDIKYHNIRFFLLSPIYFTFYQTTQAGIKCCEAAIKSLPMICHRLVIIQWTPEWWWVVLVLVVSTLDLQPRHLCSIPCCAQQIFPASVFTIYLFFAYFPKSKYHRRYTFSCNFKARLFYLFHLNLWFFSPLIN